MSRELSSVLDHIEKISELDLDGVPPTSHVIDVENVLRPDEPRPSWPVERVLESGARSGRRRLPRPHAGPMSADVLRLSAAEAAERVRAGDLGAAELFSAYRDRIDQLDDRLGAFLWTADEPPARRRRRPARPGAGGGQGPVLHGGRSDDRRVPHPRGTQAAVHGDRRAAAGRRRRADARQDEHGRVRDGLVERELRLRHRAQPVGPGACSGRLQRRVGGGRGGRPRAVGDRHGHRRVDPPARVAVRHRGTEADLRGDLPLRHGRVRVLAGPVRPADAHGHRRGAAAAPPRRPRPLRLDLARSAGGGAAAEPHRPEGAAVRGAARARLPRRGGGDRRRRGLRPHPRPHHRARRGGGGGRACPMHRTGSPPTT